jgi:hypothetical protein
LKRRTKKLLLMDKIFLVLSLGACSSPQPARSFAEAPPSQKQAAAAISVFPKGRPPASGFTNVAKVEGYFCKSGVFDAAGTRARAVAEIKYRAYLQGANAIAQLSCAIAESVEKCPDCWVCVQCEGEAIKK